MTRQTVFKPYLLFGTNSVQFSTYCLCKIYNTCFLIQKHSKVEMRRFLASERIPERVDRADLNRSLTSHDWRDILVPRPRTRTTSFTTRASPSTTPFNFISAGFNPLGVQLPVPASTTISRAAAAYSRAAARASAAELMPPPPPGFSASALLPPFLPSIHSTPVRGNSAWLADASAAHISRSPVYRLRGRTPPAPPPPTSTLPRGPHQDLHTSENLTSSRNSVNISNNPFSIVNNNAYVDTIIAPCLVPTPAQLPAGIVPLPIPVLVGEGGGWIQDLQSSLTGSLSGTETIMDSSDSCFTISAAYLQCRSSRRKKIAFNVHDISSSSDSVTINAYTCEHLGSFDRQYDNAISNCYIGTRYANLGKKQNISSTFDPGTLSCLTCSPTHAALENMSGTGCPITLILSDQTCPPVVETEGSCIRVIRVEDGSLGELSDLALEIFPHGIPDNCVILLGSGTNLLRSGSAGYACAWIEANKKLCSLSPSIKVCPLPPFLTEISPGRIFSDVMELHCWFSTVYAADSRGLQEVWNHYICQLKTAISDPPLLANTKLQSVTYPGDIYGRGSIVLSFSSNSSSPTTLMGIDRKAVLELLLVIKNSLNREFFTNLGPEIAIPRDPSLPTEKNAKELHIVILGGSHMRKVKPFLEGMGAAVTDLSISGWVTHTKAVQTLLDNVSIHLSGPTIPENTVYVMDFLGNSSVGFSQSDDSFGMPCKINGTWHLLGDAVVMENATVERLVSCLEHVFNKFLKHSKKVFLPPIPRYVFKGCCGDLAHAPNVRSAGHAPNMLSEHCRVRHCMKNALVEQKTQNMRILDVLGSLTETLFPAEQVKKLRTLYSPDSVHLNDAGYRALAAGIIKECAHFSSTLQKSSSKTPRGSQVALSNSDWHGFISYDGIGKKGSFKATTRGKHSNRYRPYRGRGRAH